MLDIKIDTLNLIPQKSSEITEYENIPEFSERLDSSGLFPMLAGELELMQINPLAILRFLCKNLEKATH